MANLSAEEFTRAVGLLADEIGVHRLRDKLGAMKAFQSMRGLNSAQAIADRLYRLSGGLRLRVVPTYAFTQLWTEMVAGKVGEDGEKSLEEMADKVNACLEHDDVVAGKEGELDGALAAYRDAVAKATGPEIAYLDMLLKAVPAVADRLRAQGSAAPAPAAPEA